MICEGYKCGKDWDECVCLAVCGGPGPDTIILYLLIVSVFPNKKRDYLSPLKKSLKIASASSPLTSLTLTLGFDTGL